MRIATAIETPEQFTIRVSALLKSEVTHVYFDTSFLMWLTTLGDQARSQFIAWAGTLGERTHIPLWSMHEYHRHHAEGTLRSNLFNRAEELMNAAKAFQSEVRKYADQPLLSGQSEAAYQISVDEAFGSLKDLSDAAKRWDYDRYANEVITWMNSRACTLPTVFKSMASLGAEGTARYTQDVPPGFLDRRKEDTPARGSNKYGDLLFWQEVMGHAKIVKATTAVVLTRDRKADWFGGGPAPTLEPDWQRVKSKWLPVPSPHPTLEFELKIQANADLVLLDELYLGALLWKFGRPNFERLAAVAIAVTPGHFEKVNPPPQSGKLRAQKRREQATIGNKEASELFVAAIGPPGERVAALLARFDQDAPKVDEFIEQLGVDTFGPLSRAEIANFTRLLHDRAKQGPGPCRISAEKLLNLLDSAPADTAAASYLGFVCSAYLVESSPAARPDSPFLEEIFAWQADVALHVVLRVFTWKMTTLKSAAIYFPNSRSEKLTLRVEHDTEQQQDPVALTQIYVKRKALLREGETRSAHQLRTLIGHAQATIRQIVKAIAQYYGIPFDHITVEGGDAEDERSIPELIGLLEFSRFDQAETTDEPLTDVADSVADGEDGSEDDDDVGVGIEED